jgi:outer membrane protein assembly factor BamB
MSAQQLLDKIEQQGLLEDKVLASLRKQVAEKNATPNQVIKTLVSKGLLTKFQAKKLMDDVAAEPPQTDDEEIVDLAPIAPVTPAAPSTPELSLNDDLGMAPLDDSPELAPLDETPELSPLDDGGGLAPLDDGGGLQPLNDGGGLEPLGGDGGGLQPLGDGGGLEPLGGGGLEPLGGGGLEPLGGGGLEPLGGGSGLEPMGGGAPDATSAADAPAATKSKGGYKAPTKDPNRLSVWDSKLLLGGGFVLMTMIITAIALIIWMGSAVPQETFDAAMDAYSSQSYGQAIKLFDEYVEKWPSEKDANECRVRSGTAQLWQIKDARNPRKSLDTIKEILPTIEANEKFGSIRPELASILTNVVAEIAKKADAANDTKSKQDLIEMAEEGMELVDNPSYIPSSMRQAIANRLGEIKELIGKVKRDINRYLELNTAVEAILAAIENDPPDTSKGREIQVDLLRKYPGLRNDESLVEALTKVSAAQQAMVKLDQTETLADTEDQPKPPGTRVILAQRRGKTVEQLPNFLTLVLARGMIYALDVPTGDVKWTRFVGYDTKLHPIMLSQQIGGDALIFDGIRHEILRVKSDTGDLVWRQTIGSEFHEPVISEDKLYVAAVEGTLYEIDLLEGHTGRQLKFPQRLATGPTFSTNNLDIFYQVADHSNIYVINKRQLKCLEVYFLGHAPGAVQGRPATTMKYLLIPVNTSSSSSLMHVAETGDGGLNLKQVPGVKPKRLKGQVVSPLQTLNRQVVVFTDLGSINVYEVDSENENDPVQDSVTPMLATANQASIHNAKIDAGQVWVASRQIARFEIQFAQNKVVGKWVMMKGDEFIGPVQLFRNIIISTRRTQSGTGIIATAMDSLDGQVIWETQLSVPPIQIIPNEAGDKVYVISSSGSYFELSEAQLEAGGIVNEPVDTALMTAPTAFAHGVPLTKGRWAFTSESSPGQVLFFDPNQVATRIRALALTGGPGIKANATAPPTAFKGGMLVPLDIGQVQLLNGEENLKPFQPKLQAGTKVNWSKPAVINNGTEFVVADDQRHLYRVGVSKIPTPFLKSLGYAELESDIVSDLAATGSTLFGVTRAGAVDTIASFKLPDFTVGKTHPLGGRVVWGPKLIGENVYAVSSDEGLICLAENEEKLWEHKSVHGTIVDVVDLNADTLLLTSQEGNAWTVKKADGSAGAKGSVNNPLRGGSLMFKGKMLLPGSDGTIHIVPMGGGS